MLLSDLTIEFRIMWYRSVFLLGEHTWERQDSSIDCETFQGFISIKHVISTTRVFSVTGNWGQQLDSPQSRAGSENPAYVRFSLSRAELNICRVIFTIDRPFAPFFAVYSLGEDISLQTPGMSLCDILAISSKTGWGRVGTLGGLLNKVQYGEAPYRFIYHFCKKRTPFYTFYWEEIPLSHTYFYSFSCSAQ